ncbi:MAG TPA: bifunctional diaminohydroxyphosphoribosylaminopyrimidine deaminase/5-amino-6-(5-phosphoribosylamino)uracil reductase RibD [Phnomibacter sp.]|nr:bifunctional diaminohydroxyphosphoribosylaminopyrimidine deaminase/5-amino-6-(5-phosphoribosylamino)uracil reductase RibD [Phnomibacter sp.]
MVAAHEVFMERCLQLAALAQNSVAPNPMVGAVLVYEGRVLAQGFHQQYGGPHAEVNCLNNLAPGLEKLLPAGTLYVSLEPCAHTGKTPPCADLIIAKGIKKVVVACRDPFVQVNGRGIEKLKAAGVEVILGICEQQALALNRRFMVQHTLHRPFVVLKWAQTADGFMAGPGSQRTFISNAATNRLVHRWRMEESSILVGSRTALADNPQLNNRYWPGRQPLRLVIDLPLSLPPYLHVLQPTQPTLVFNTKIHTEQGLVQYYQVTEQVSLIAQMMNALQQRNIQSVLVEGGAYTHQQFFKEQTWDELRIITNAALFVGNGIAAPQLPAAAKLVSTQMIGDNQIQIFKNINPV